MQEKKKQTTPLFLRKLLEFGIVERKNKEIELDQLNDYLKPIGYAAIKWPDSEEIILKNFRYTTIGGFGNVISPWKESTTKEAKNAIYNISLSSHNQQPTSDLGILSLLEEYRYIKYDDERKVASLDLRSLINFEEFLISTNPSRYKRCTGCNLIVEWNDMHRACSGNY